MKTRNASDGLRVAARLLYSKYGSTEVRKYFRPLQLGLGKSRFIDNKSGKSQLALTFILIFYGFLLLRISYVSVITKVNYLLKMKMQQNIEVLKFCQKYVI